MESSTYSVDMRVILQLIFSIIYAYFIIVLLWLGGKKLIPFFVYFCTTGIVGIFHVWLNELLFFVDSNGYITSRSIFIFRGIQYFCSCMAISHVIGMCLATYNRLQVVSKIGASEMILRRHMKRYLTCQFGIPLCIGACSSIAQQIFEKNAEGREIWIRTDIINRITHVSFIFAYCIACVPAYVFTFSLLRDLPKTIPSMSALARKNQKLLVIYTMATTLFQVVAGIHQIVWLYGHFNPNTTVVSMANNALPWVMFINVFSSPILIVIFSDFMRYKMMEPWRKRHHRRVQNAWSNAR